MKILITGANGMLAKAVRERFVNEELVLTDVKVTDTPSVEKLDITDLEKVKEFVTSCKPDVIINCAAYTAVDAAETNEDLARKINADGPRNLAIAAKNAGSTLVHISTDYVFDGEKPLDDEPYVEANPTNPQSIYGITKLEGEEPVKENMEQYYIFRTAWLYGDGKNFVRTMLRLSKENKQISVVADQHGSPTYTVDLADIIAQTLEKKIPFGVYHTTNLRFTTWNKFAEKIFELAGIDCVVKPLTSEEYPQAAKRPKNSKLSKEKILSYGIEIPSWEDALTRYLEKELSNS